uniref:uncharacterized protein LOC124007455 isoform X2 n=1 Tax=Oncorhynchus gorbuscha TaxID=8017 RepID=UPI001EAF541D|nr:uncharacterized protein LOC124007455 isoform X2 [Oncorhynchus gorbuscha]
MSLHQSFSWHWWKTFYPMRNAGGDFVVRYSAGRTYNRQSNEATFSIFTRTEMEDFLGEAACMKEFDHPNIMRGQ